MGLLHRCWQRLRTRRQVILSPTILPFSWTEGAPLCGRGPSFDFGRESSIPFFFSAESPSRPASWSSSASAIRKPSNSSKSCVSRFMASPTGIRKRRQSATTIRDGCRTLCGPAMGWRRGPSNPTFRSSLDLSNHFGRRASPPTPSRRLKFSSAPMPSGFSSIAWVPAAGLVRTLHDLSWYPAISYSKLICLPSRASSFFLIGSPPPKPVRLPSLPMTRWHGMMMGIGFEPFANPTARSALGLPMP